MIGPLTRGQVQIVEAHPGMIKEFSSLTKQVSQTDFRAFEPSGDHLSPVTTRFRRHYSF